MDFTAQSINQRWAAEGKIELYRQMVRIRRFEQDALKYYQTGQMGGWLILSIGQESVAVTVRSLMGPDDHEMRAKIQPAIERARDHQRPTVLEISTYRYYGFTVSDANHRKYRTGEEIEEHKSRDPLMHWRERLIAERLLDEASAVAISEEAKTEVQAAVKFAEASAPPDVSDITRDVYWETDHGTGRSKIGKHFFE